jgi:hypothetical protein
MKADSGASRTYLKGTHAKFLQNHKKLQHGPTATLPDGSQINTTAQGNLPLHSSLNIEGFVYPHLPNESLLSIGQLCNQGCIAIFEKEHFYIMKNGKLILKGRRNFKDGLWDVPFEKHKIDTINYIINKDQSKTELAKYLHACAFSPVISTLQDCITKGNFITWPGIDNINFKKILKTTEATLQGHLDQERKGLSSTKETDTNQDNENSAKKDAFPPQEKIKSSSCYYMIYNISTTRKTYTDLTGRFPHQSSRGNNYIFVAYNYDGNAILVEPIKNREADTIINTWTKIHKRLTNNGIATTHYILDNECSSAFKDTLRQHDITFELVPPHQHRRNAAERAIRTFKNHFLAGLATCHPDFPIREWDRLLQQAELTINLLRNSRLNPKLSAWAFLFGNHDFNKCPLLPPGTKVILHAKPGHRASWAFHGEQGWYTGPAIDHYRCLTCYVPKTHKSRITDTAAIVPSHIPIPQASLNDHIRKTADDLVHLLHKNTNSFSKGTPLSAKAALLDIAELLHRDTTPPISPLISKPSLPPSAATSEGAETDPSKEATSEGGPKIQLHPPTTDVFKKNITPINLKDIPIHPGLYTTHTPSTSLKQTNSKPTTPPPSLSLAPTESHTTSTLQSTTNFNKVIDEMNFNNVLHEYNSIPKHTPRQKAIKHTQLPLPRTPASYIPFPKHFKPTRTYKNPVHPMLLRNRFKSQHSYRHRAARHLLAQNLTGKLLHIFDDAGKKQSLDTLLRLNP